MILTARLAALTLALAVTSPIADQPKAADEALSLALKDVINRGADLYNSGDQAACYRLFEGSLMTLKPSLDRRPELQKLIAKGLASAEKDPLTWRRAFTLRDTLDKVRAELNKGPEKLKMPKVDEDEKKDKDADKDAG